MSPRSRAALPIVLLTLTLASACARSQAPVSFVLVNSASQELAFNMDRGWQPNLFAYTGKPPRARWILMFPKHCTAACELAETERCPDCREPERAKEQLAAQRFERVAPGDELVVPWDGQTYVYERTRGKGEKGGRKRCECHRVEPAPPATYTVKACGLRLTQSAEKRSRLQCAEAEMTLPAREPIRIELEFPDPGRERTSGR